MADRDIIDLIQEDHREFRTLLASVDTVPSDQRQDLFRTIVAELARHEAAEEAIVHPTLRDEVDGGDAIAKTVLKEESEAEELLAKMEKMDPSSGEFMDALHKLRGEVLEHAEHEEREEHPLLRRELAAQRLLEMAEGWTTLKEQAPTRPHPNTPQTPEVRAAVGPVAGVFDRARDAARELVSR